MSVERIEKIETEQVEQGKSIALLGQMASSTIEHNKKVEEKLDALHSSFMEQQGTLRVVADFRNRVEVELQALKEWIKEHELRHSDFDKEYAGTLDGAKKFGGKFVEKAFETFFKIFFWVVITIAGIMMGVSKFQ